LSLLYCANGMGGAESVPSEPIEFPYFPKT
jgi:hypothetical protein